MINRAADILLFFPFCSMLEAGLDDSFRHLIRYRVSLLSVLTHLELQFQSRL